jgi:integrative and conjugative element protein (TIGR02256 family)
MSAEAWLAEFALIAEDDFRIDQARSFAGFIQRYGASIATYVEGRRKDVEELVILDFTTGVPQRPVYPLRHVERIAVRFPKAEAQPGVTMLRDNFPDTEHQQLVPEGMPPTLCIDDRPWAEAQLTWTPAELVHRIHTWFSRASRGELHDARQPLDPIYIGSNVKFFVPRSVLRLDQRQHLLCTKDMTDPTFLRIMQTASGPMPPITNLDSVVVLPYVVSPAAMRRLKHNPTNFSSLAAMLRDRGVDLLADLKDRLRYWIQDASWASAFSLNSKLVVITEMPVVSPDNQRRDGVDHRAFITGTSPGEIGVAMGALQAAPPELSRLGFVQSLASTPVEIDLTHVKLVTAEVHLEFDPDLAARISGRQERDSRKAVLVGAGSIGSHTADCLAREGRFAWTVIDDDQLLPHNLARHIALKGEVAARKATVTAKHLNSIFVGTDIATAINANLFATDANRQIIDQAIDQAEIIIDATASIVAARALSDAATTARRVSAFFNPNGEAAVALIEPTDRSLTLRDLEAQYYVLLIRTPELDLHLGKEPETVAYTGACRALTNRISQSRAAVLSGLAAMGISNTIDQKLPAINVWSLAKSGAVAAFSPMVENVIRWKMADWEITLDMGLSDRLMAMRNEKKPNETGGILFGLVDIPDKKIHLVDASPAPPDSTEKRTEFVRGMHGVKEDIDRVFRVTGGQIRYVGEWHSHPPNASAGRSSTDDRQLDWLATLMGLDELPALMLIAAEREISLNFANQEAVRIGDARRS